MIKKWIIPSLMVLGAVFLNVSCGKKDVQVPVEELTAQEKLSMQIFGNKNFQWNKNDVAWMASLKKLKSKLYGDEGRALTCSIANGDSTYGWFSDTTIIEGPYVLAKNVSYETIAEECPDLNTAASDAKDYLIAEGYEDLADTYYYDLRENLRYNAIHAANALMDLKAQFEASQQSQPGQRGAFNCLLQAIGYGGIAELAANYSQMSRVAIVRAVGRIIMRYTGWIGTAIAIGSFIDCITD